MTTQVAKHTHGVSPVAIIALVALLILGAGAALYMAFDVSGTVTFAQTPRQAALTGLADVARADAQAVVERGMATVEALSAKAANEPALLYSPAWRSAWLGAWRGIARNSDGSMRAAATDCWSAVYFGRILDIPDCVQGALRVIEQEAGR